MKIWYNTAIKNSTQRRSIFNGNQRSVRSSTQCWRQGENEYYNVRSSLSDYISDYVYYNAKDKKTTMKGEKYLSAPTVVAIKNGQILDVYESTIETTEKDSGATKVFTTEDKNKAKEAFNALIDAYLAQEEATEEVEDKE